MSKIKLIEVHSHDEIDIEKRISEFIDNQNINNVSVSVSVSYMNMMLGKLYLATIVYND